MLPLAAWPQADAAAWAAARDSAPGPFSRNPPHSSATYDIYATGYGYFLWHLESQGHLEPAETPIERPTLERLGDYYDRLVAVGSADYTVVARFDALRGALRLMYPTADLTFHHQARRRLNPSDAAHGPPPALRAGFP